MKVFGLKDCIVHTMLSRNKSVKDVKNFKEFSRMLFNLSARWLPTTSSNLICTLPFFLWRLSIADYPMSMTIDLDH